VVTSSNVAELLQSRRRDLDIDQATLAARIGVSQQTIRRWEVGSNVPGRKYIKPLAKALKVEGTFVHPIAGYAPDVATQDFDELLASVVASVDRFSNQHLLDLVDALWRAYRVRVSTGR
jgi:transcriptional regulator with XRE-family HTH domain